MKLLYLSLLLIIAFTAFSQDTTATNTDLDTDPLEWNISLIYNFENDFVRRRDK